MSFHQYEGSSASKSPLGLGSHLAGEPEGVADLGRDVVDVDGDQPGDAGLSRSGQGGQPASGEGDHRGDDEPTRWFLSLIPGPVEPTLNRSDAPGRGFVPSG